MRRSAIQRDHQTMRRIGTFRWLDNPAEAEASWAEEIKRRVEELRNGTVETIPAEQVFAEARSWIEQIAKARF